MQALSRTQNILSEKHIVEQAKSIPRKQSQAHTAKQAQAHSKTKQCYYVCIHTHTESKHTSNTKYLNERSQVGLHNVTIQFRHRIAKLLSLDANELSREKSNISAFFFVFLRKWCPWLFLFLFDFCLYLDFVSSLLFYIFSIPSNARADLSPRSAALIFFFILFWLILICLFFDIMYSIPLASALVRLSTRGRCACGPETHVPICHLAPPPPEDQAWTPLCRLNNKPPLNRGTAASPFCVSLMRKRLPTLPLLRGLNVRKVSCFD